MNGTSLLLAGVPVVSIGLVLAASAHDIVARTIPNGLVLAVALIGGLAALLGGYFPGSALAAFIVFGLSVLCWRRGWMGGGDAKLLGAAALGMPPVLVPSFIAAVALAGGVLALLYLAARPLLPAPSHSRPGSLWRRILRAERWRIRRGCPLPYACAIAAGVVFVTL